MRSIIIWIDDRPERYDIIKSFLPFETLVIFAYGFDQIKYCIDHIPYNLVILDHDMPGFDGTQVIEKFDFNDVPIILCSCNDPARERMMEKLSVLGYTCRPAPAYKPDDLIEAVHEGLNIQTKSWING